MCMDNLSDTEAVKRGKTGLPSMFIFLFSNTCLLEKCCDCSFSLNGHFHFQCLLSSCFTSFLWSEDLWHFLTVCDSGHMVLVILKHPRIATWLVFSPVCSIKSYKASSVGRVLFCVPFDCSYWHVFLIPSNMGSSLSYLPTSGFLVLSSFQCSYWRIRRWSSSLALKHVSE